jgi:hypothetical protein
MEDNYSSDAPTSGKALSLNHSPDLFKRVEIMFTIVDSGMGGEVVKSLRECGVTYNLMSVGYGASGYDIAGLLGLHDFEKDVVISVVTEERVREMLSMLMYRFDLDKPDKGIAFTIPISGVSGPLALRYISGIAELAST